MEIGCYDFQGKTRTLGEFFNVARNITGLYFDQEPSTADVEVGRFIWH